MAARLKDVVDDFKEIMPLVRALPPFPLIKFHLLSALSPVSTLKPRAPSNTRHDVTNLPPIG